MLYETLVALFEYNPNTGEFFHKHRPVTEFKSNKDWVIWNKKYEGKRADRKHTNGYRCITYQNKKYYAHRMAFLYMNKMLPVGEIDHIDHNKENNRFENLRDCEHSINSKNRPLQQNNKSGEHGVYYDELCNKWSAQITRNGKTHRLGRFLTVEEAVAARKTAEKLSEFHENHGGVKYE